MPKEYRPAEDAGVFSLYTAIADRKARNAQGRKEGGAVEGGEIFAGAVHELQNQLQSIGMGLDLLQLTHADPLEYRTISLGIERASRLLREVQEYFFPSEPNFSTSSLAAVVEETVRGVAQEWEQPGRSVRVVCPEVLPALRLDWQQLGKALERVLRGAYGLLPVEGGEILVEAGLREERAHAYVEIKVRICGAAELGGEEAEVFTPFWRVNGYQAGLSLVLARRIMNRCQGQLTFDRTSPHQGCFTMLLRIHQGR
ncbi:MAG: hypothetical protein HYZ72_19080 [Deltaproteobacteria bacterium]|nr:hypothetical protein [Deltaproteobacteria bacterium]